MKQFIMLLILLSTSLLAWDCKNVKNKDDTRTVEVYCHTYMVINKKFY